MTTLDPRSDEPTTTTRTPSEMKEDQNVELRKNNTKSSEDKPRTSVQNSRNSVVTADPDVVLRNTRNSSEATTIHNPTRVIRQQQQQQQKMVVPLLVKKQTKPDHSNFCRKIKTRLFNLEDMTKNTTTLSIGPQRQTTKSRTTTRTVGHFLSVMLPKWRRRRHNFVTEQR